MTLHAESKSTLNSKTQLENSTLRLNSPDQVIGDEHYDVARKIIELLQSYKGLQDIIAILGKCVRMCTCVCVCVCVCVVRVRGRVRE